MSSNANNDDFMDEDVLHDIMDDYEEIEPELVWHRVACNHPSITQLQVGSGDLLSHAFDLSICGRSIGNNSQLKDLEIYHLHGYQQLSQQDIMKFFVQVALNRSLERLRFQHICFFDGTMFQILSPFFKANQYFKCLRIVACRFESRGPLALRHSLSSFNTLEELAITYCPSLSDSELAHIITALEVHSKLKVLDLSGNHNIGIWASASISALVRSCNNDLASLILNNARLDDANALIIAAAFEHSSRLTHLNLGNNKAITRHGWRCIFVSTLSPTSNIQTMNISANSFCADTIMHLAFSLARSRSLKRLDLSSNWNEHQQELNELFLRLQTPTLHLEEIDVSDNAYTDSAVLSLARVAQSSIKKLRMCRNPQITLNGWRAFSRVALESPCSSLKRLLLSDCNLSEQSAIVLANSLANNNKLEMLELGTLFVHPDPVWAAFTQILCSKESINDTFMSNHTLQQVCWKDEEYLLPEDLLFLLELNRCKERQVARQKITNVHFKGASGVHMLIEDMIGLALLPHVMSWMAHDNVSTSSDVTVLYHFSRSYASLFDIDRIRSQKRSNSSH